MIIQAPFNKNIKTYSRLSVAISLALTFYSVLISYNFSSIFFLPSLASLVLSLICIIVGANEFYRLLTFPVYNSLIQGLLVKSTSSILFLSSVHGLFNLFSRLNIRDHSILFIPFVFISFFLAGASLGIFQKNPIIK